MIFIDKEVKKRYQIMSTFECNDEYQNKLRYAYRSYIKRTIMSYIGLMNVFGFEFCLLILILRKKNALMISLTVVFVVCSIVFTLLSDTAELDDFLTIYLNSIARKNYTIIKNDNIKLFMEDDDTLCIIQNGYVVSTHKIKNPVDQYQVEVQQYLCIDNTGDIRLTREYILNCEGGNHNDNYKKTAIQKNEYIRKFCCLSRYIA